MKLNEQISRKNAETKKNANNFNPVWFNTGSKEMLLRTYEQVYFKACFMNDLYGIKGLGPESQ